MNGAKVPPRRPARPARWADALHARAAVLSRGASGFAVDPDRRIAGSAARGREIMEGRLLLGGRRFDPSSADLWTSADPGSVAEAALHGFVWLDDLATLGHPRARRIAQDAVGTWLGRFGAGAGWTPGVTARRLTRWIDHSAMLLAGRDAAWRRRFFRALGRQTLFLSRRWRSAEPGAGRIRALAALVHAASALEGMQDLAGPATTELVRALRKGVDPAGAIASRNPEALLDLLADLTGAIAALRRAGREVPQPLTEAAARIAPVLRALRHADGGLARMHGGGRGAEGLLDLALAASGDRTPPGHGLAMGFARLAAARTTVLVDAAPPPVGAASVEAHASALALELTSGRRPLVVSCGPGAAFGSDWRRAGRATPSHSAMCIEGVSSARLGAETAQGEPLTDGPGAVLIDRTDAERETRLSLAHDGWAASHGLTCHRHLALTRDGRALSGEDTLVAASPAARRICDRVKAARQDGTIPFTVRFHLHPDADPELDHGGSVLITLRSGERWVFRHDGAAELTLEPSVYLDAGRIEPRASQQIVLSGQLTEHAARVGWTLAKALGTPSNLRDLEIADAADAGS